MYFEGDRNTLRLLLRMMYADGPSCRRSFLYDCTQEQLCAAIEAADKYAMIGLLHDLDLYLGVLEGCSKHSVNLEEAIKLYEFSCRLHLPHSEKAFADAIRGKVRRGEHVQPGAWSLLSGEQVAGLLVPAARRILSSRSYESGSDSELSIVI